jgi:1-acyl-sn-glycerol-3-phosphate acyltransferase
MGIALRASVKLAAVAAWTVLLTPVYAAAKPMSRRLARAVLGTWHRGALAIAGVRVVRRGAPCTAPGTLMVANHVSYLDIPVLGALAGVDFVAKADIAQWPAIGPIGRLIDTLYVDRRPGAAMLTRDALAMRLRRGGRFAMFPEGTTTDGRRVLPFRSAPFAALESAGGQVLVQPVTLRYAALDGLPLDRSRRWDLAWCGEAELVPHLWRLLDCASIVAEVEFHAPIAEGADRKALAQRCHDVVAAGLARARPPLWWLGGDGVHSGALPGEAGLAGTSAARA